MDRPRLVASDVDGTLLTPLEQLTRRTKQAVARVVASGVPFVLVSGRPPRWIPPVARLARLRGHAVCANGAALYDIAGDRVLEVRGLSPVQLHDVADVLAAALPKAHLAAERVGTSAHDHSIPQYVAEDAFRNPWDDGTGLSLDGTSSETMSRVEVLGRTAIKLMVSDPRMTSGEMAAAAREMLGDSVGITYSTNAGLIEISAPRVSKATGLATVAELHGVRPAEVLAFGDMPNDVEMLRWAGHGVAMANAHPVAARAADEITTSNSEDGVARILDRWF